MIDVVVKPRTPGSRTVPRVGGAGRVAFAPTRSPLDAAALVIVMGLALLFAAAIAGALRPPLPTDPVQAGFEGGL